MIPAIFFDMDGVLVDSEPEWQRSEIAVFGSLGVRLCERDCMQTKGMRIDEVVRHWHTRAPWENPSIEATTERIVTDMENRLRSHGLAKDGAVEALRDARAASQVVAIVSSSPHRLIDAVVERLGVRDLIDFQVSGDDVPYGKPHPEIYLRAAERAGTDAPRAWVIEDSLFGVLAAKAARMNCIAIPEAPDRADPRFAIADEIQPSLRSLTRENWSSRR